MIGRLPPGLTRRIPVSTSWGCEWRSEGLCRFVRATRMADGSVVLRTHGVAVHEADKFCYENGLDRGGLRVCSWDPVQRARSSSDSRVLESWLIDQESSLREKGLPEEIAWGEVWDGCAYLVRQPDIQSWVRQLPYHAQGVECFLPASAVFAVGFQGFEGVPPGDGVILVPLSGSTVALVLSDREIQEVLRMPAGTMDTRTQEDQENRWSLFLAPWRNLDWKRVSGLERLPSVFAERLASHGFDRELEYPESPDVDPEFLLAAILALQGVQGRGTEGVPTLPTPVRISGLRRIRGFKTVRKWVVGVSVPLFCLLWACNWFAKQAPPPPSGSSAEIRKHFARWPAMSARMERAALDFGPETRLTRLMVVRRDSTRFEERATLEFPSKAASDRWLATHPRWATFRLSVGAGGAARMEAVADEPR